MLMITAFISKHKIQKAPIPTTLFYPMHNSTPVSLNYHKQATTNKLQVMESEVIHLSPFIFRISLLLWIHHQLAPLCLACGFLCSLPSCTHRPAVPLWMIRTTQRQQMRLSFYQMYKCGQHSFFFFFRCLIPDPAWCSVPWSIASTVGWQLGSDQWFWSIPEFHFVGFFLTPKTWCVLY